MLMEEAGWIVLCTLRYIFSFIDIVNSFACQVWKSPAYNLQKPAALFHQKTWGQILTHQHASKPQNNFLFDYIDAWRM